jgi:UDP-2-acetamido-2,6-beta-L-arabino-hexul-4-ose reductase
MNNLKILLLGSNGFIGSSLLRYLNKKYIVNCAGVATSYKDLEKLIFESDIIIHTIGVTRSNDENDFFRINVDFSIQLYAILKKHEYKKIIYFSSIHYHRNDIYGFTKRFNEYLFSKDEHINKNQTFIIRTPGIFGPGAKPNNVSVVSTFCYNKINNFESLINDPDKELEILYIKDLILLIEKLFENKKNIELIYPETVKISVIDLHNLIKEIGDKPTKDLEETYASSFLKNILSTYNSFKNAPK